MFYRQGLTAVPALGRTSPTRGFTLIELLVVIAIILLLIAIVVPTLGLARSQAVLVRCAANMQQIGVGIATFASDHTDELPLGPALEHPFFAAFELTYRDVADSQVWIGSRQQFNAHGTLIDGYLPNRSAMYCPGDDTTDPDSELAKIGTSEDAYSSYIYRQRDALAGTGSRLSQLINSQGQKAQLLVLDRQSLVVAIANAYRTNHRNRQSNLLFVDGHTRQVSNDGDHLFALRENDFLNFPQRLDEIMFNGDHAGTGAAEPFPFP